MFGMGIFEILVIVIVAVIFLGPEKLPQAMIDIVKFFKAVKKTLNDAKDTFDKELHMSEIKKEALEYKNSFESSIDNVTKDIQLKEIDDMFGQYKEENQTKSKPIKTPKIPAPDGAIAYEEPKKRGRKPKNQQPQDVQKTPPKSAKENSKEAMPKTSPKSQTKSTSPKSVETKAPKITKPIKSQATSSSTTAPQSKTPVVTPKATKSVGFKKTTKTSKES